MCLHILSSYGWEKTVEEGSVTTPVETLKWRGKAHSLAIAVLRQAPHHEGPFTRGHLERIA